MSKWLEIDWGHQEGADNARAYAQRLKAEQEQSVQQLNAQISQKADSQKLSAEGRVHDQVWCCQQRRHRVRTDVETTRKELEGTRRDLVDEGHSLSRLLATVTSCSN
jgi:hypothetical protein